MKKLSYWIQYKFILNKTYNIKTSCVKKNILAITMLSILDIRNGPKTTHTEKS